MIEPTIGRIVWFWPGDKLPSRAFTVIDRAQPCRADIVFVHAIDRCNLAVTDHAGLAWTVAHVRLEQHEGAAGNGPYCEWMPFQKGQAKAAEVAASLGNAAAQFAGNPTDEDRRFAQKPTA